MFFIQLKDLYKSYFIDQNLIQNINLTISSGNILGIIGRNGEGKTTLLKIIAGKLSPDSGEIIFSANDLSMGYHTQFLSVPIDSDFTIEDFVLASFGEIYNINKEILELSNCNDSASIERLMLQQARFDELGGYQIQNDLDKALITLELYNKHPNDKVNTLSGGEKTRIQLAKIVIENPDILLLDEPTNHLDSESINWLTGFILARKGITIIVSHDRTFLNNSVDSVFEIERGDTAFYAGTYDDYIEQKELKTKQALDEIQRNTLQADKLKIAVNAKRSLAVKQHFQRPDKKTYGRHSRTIMRNKAGKKAHQARMYQKRVDSNLDRNDLIAPKKYRNIGFKIESLSSSSDFVLKVKELSLEVGNEVLIESATFDVLKGDKIAISGRNGSGKTTLLEHIINYEETGSDTILKGKSTQLAYYSQEHEKINDQLTVLDDFRNSVPMLESEASAYLHTLLFKYGQLKQKVGDLSQGEKSKLALAKLLAVKHNLLILDEPTNHLDIASREVLENALNVYEGSILVVSHDKYFLEKIDVNKRFEIINKKLVQL